MKKTVTLFYLIAASVMLFAQPKHADILFTSDIHSFLNNLTKVKTLIDSQKEKNPDTLVFDDGDFSMGTLYQSVFETQASELRTLGLIGCDVTTMGNHEFDYGAESLAKMFDTALKSNEPLPQFVLCNADWNKDNSYTKTVKEALVSRYGAKDYIMLKKGNLNVAVTGVFGIEAFLFSPGCEITFEDPIKAVKRTVKIIKENENADLIICLSHSGVNLKNQKKSEDEQLALAVPELDVIISGHTHTKLEKPIIIGNTIIGACEAYNKYLGNLSITQKNDGRWQLDDYYLTDLSSDIPEDEEIKARLETFSESIDSEYLSRYGFTSDQVLTKAAYDYDISRETGYLMADAVKKTVENLGQKVDVSVVPSGVLRGTYSKGEVKVSDVFESYSLGVDAQGLTGYSLIEVYLNGNELKQVAEIDASLSPLMDTVRLFTSGLSYTYNPKRLILNKVTDVYLIDNEGNKVPADKNKLYRVVTDMYTGMMIGNITGTTKGIVKIVPKKADGSLITDWQEVVIMQDPQTEQKGWLAIASEFAKYDVLPSFSDEESKAIVCEASINPIKLLKAPSKLSLIIRCAIILIILIITAIILLKKLFKKK